jgi:hypothetical protein
MDEKQATLEQEDTTRFPVLYVAFELGNSTWKLACSDGEGSGPSPASPSENSSPFRTG